MVLKADFLTYGKCIQDFARAHPDKGFPESLESLGPEGNACLSDELSKGIKGEFRIQYTPGARSGNGFVETYNISAIESVPKSDQRTTMYSDESARIWFRYDSPSQSGHPYLIYFPATAFSTAENCAWQAYGRVWIISEGTQERKTTDRNEFLKNCFGFPEWGERRVLVAFGYSYEYRFSLQPSGNAAGFEIDVRPTTYGVSALRSYLAIGTFTDDGKPLRFTVHATPQDRLATEADPLALPQEVDMPIKLQAADAQWCGDRLCE